MLSIAIKIVYDVSTQEDVHIDANAYSREWFTSTDESYRCWTDDLKQHEELASAFLMKGNRDSARMHMLLCEGAVLSRARLAVEYNIRMGKMGDSFARKNSLPSILDPDFERPESWGNLR